MMRQAGVIRVETIEQLMDVAQIVSSQPLPAGPGRRRLQQLPGARQGGGGQCGGAGARRGADRHRRRPRRRHVRGAAGAAAQPAGSPHRGHRPRRRGGAAAGPRPHRGKDRRSAGRMFGGGRQTRGGGVQRASWTRPSTWKAWWADERRTDGPVPCYSNPGAAVAALAAVVRYAQWLDRDQGLFVEPEGCDPDGTRDELERLLPRRRAASSSSGWTQETAARPAGATTASGWSRPSASTPPRRPWRPRTGSAGRWR